MNFDRNTIFGFIALGILFIGFFWYSSREQAALQKERAKQDSIAAAGKPKAAPGYQKTDSTRADSLKNAAQSGGFSAYLTPNDSLSYAENDLLKIAFTKKGGQPKWVELKKFKGPDSATVKLASTGFDKLTYNINTGGGAADVTNFYFSGGNVVQHSDKTQTITYNLAANGSSVTHQFIIRPDNYMIDFNLIVDGVPQLFTNNQLNLIWQNKAIQLQKDLKYEREQSQISYRENGDYDHGAATSSNSEEFKKPVNWVAVKQQFFNTTLINKDNFLSGSISWKAPPAEEAKTVVEATANLKVQLNNTRATVPLAIYYGPTDYKTLKRYGNDMENMVNLGSGMFAFVKYINRWVIIPVFNWFTKLTSNFGIVILLLTVFIRLLVSPLMYPGYLTSAKMKALKPDLAKLREKYPDQQQYAVEQMKFTREAGVNTLAGCLPSLLQIPIFFALYSFFNSNVALRGQSFLWAHDLSQYDSVLNLPFNIPLYGDHVSLFTITAIITSFLISIYSMSSATQDQNNPVLKYMPYIFPFILLFVFNKLPAGLTWYYTVSNLITLILQFIIQNYIINHDKILAKIEENRKKPKTKSKFQERLEAMQEQQRQMKEAQSKRR